MASSWRGQLESMGSFIRSQRKLANLSLRELAALTDLSNAYLSQIERGLHEPSVRVLRSVADALGVPVVTVLEKAGVLERDAVPTVVEAIAADPVLSPEQKEALLAVYRSYAAEQRAGG